MKVKVLVISDSCFRKEREDISGKVMERILRKWGWRVVGKEILPDEELRIEEVLRKGVEEGVDLILTTGGTGVGSRDVTPEATRKVIEKEIPGIGELIRMKGFFKTPFSVLSRGIAGVKEKTLIVNLPGSPKGVEESLLLLKEILLHAHEILQGRGKHDHRSDIGGRE